MSVSDEDDVLAAALERGAALAGKDEHRLSRLLHPRFGWVSHRGERNNTAPWGLFGGGAGAMAASRIVRADGSVELFPSKAELRLDMRFMYLMAAAPLRKIG